MSAAGFAAAIVSSKLLIDILAAGVYAYSRQYGLALMFAGFAVADLGTLVVTM